MSNELVEALSKLTDNMSALASDVKANIKTQAEQAETLDKLKGAVAGIEAIRRATNEKLPSDAPLDDQVAEAATKKGGFRSLPLKKSLELPPGHAMLQDSDREELKRVHDYHDATVLKYHIFRKRSDATQAWQRLSKDLDFLTYKQLLIRNGFITEQKAHEVMHPDSGGVGSTLDFTLLSSTMIDRMKLDLVVGDKFREIVLTRPTQDFPVRTADAFGVLGGLGSATSPPVTGMTTGVAPWPANTNFSYPTFGTARRFDVKHLLVYQIWNDDMVEDSVVPWLPMMREDLSYYAARTMDRAILDGDEESTHMDYDVHSASATAVDFRRAWHGLRKLSKANWSGLSGSTLDDADLHTLRKTLGLYGKAPERLCYFITLKQYYDLISLGVIGSNNNLNLPASMLGSNGVLNSWWGIPLCVSEFVRTDVHTTGVNATGQSNNTSIAGIANVDRFVRARYGTVAIEETRLAPALSTVLQSDVRVDFNSWDQIAISSGQWAALSDIPCNFLINVG